MIEADAGRQAALCVARRNPRIDGLDVADSDKAARNFTRPLRFEQLHADYERFR
jgi:hypothetical protein